LRRWKELQSELDEHRVQVVTLCSDTPAQIRKGKGKHGLEAIMLSDRDLEVTRRYDVENTNTAVRPPGVAGLAIPTTILADRDGFVRWIDQTGDYQLRSQPERIRAVLREALS